MAQSGTTVYSGRFEHTLDDKNRLTIPSLWRWVHTDTETFLAIPHPDGYIAVLPPARVEKLLAQISEMKLSDRDAQRVFDVFGRLPANHRHRIHFRKTGFVAGNAMTSYALRYFVFSRFGITNNIGCASDLGGASEYEHCDYFFHDSEGK